MNETHLAPIIVPNAETQPETPLVMTLHHERGGPVSCGPRPFSWDYPTSFSVPRRMWIPGYFELHLDDVCAGNGKFTWEGPQQREVLTGDILRVMSVDLTIVEEIR